MKIPAPTLLALLLGSTLLIAAVPAFAQTADGTPPAPPSDQSAEGPGGYDDGWGWGRHHRHGRHGGMDGRRGERHDGRRGGRMMMMIDANGDGVIGADEAANMAEAAFLRHDQNRDEALDEAEFTAPPNRGWGRGWFGWGAEERAAVEKVRKEKFAVLDANKDGKVSKAEFLAEAEKRLVAADTDKDGKVTPFEFRALPRP